MTGRNKAPLAMAVKISICGDGHVVLEAVGFNMKTLAECHMDPADVQIIIDDLERGRTLARAVALPAPARLN